MTLNGGLTLANGAILDFNLVAAPGSGDAVNITSGTLNLGTTGGTLNINEFGGGGELEATTYPLIYDSSITGTASAWQVGDHVGDTGHSYSFIAAGGQFDLVVTNSASSGTWTSSGSGMSSMYFGLGSNWSTTQVPSGAGLTATFGTGTQSSVSVNGAFTVGGLVFNSTATAYSLSGGTLTLNNTGGGASISVSSGGVTPSISTTLTLADSSLTTTFNIGSGSSLDVIGTINESTPTGQTIVLTGGGILELDNGTNAYTGGTTVNNGTLNLDPVSGTAPLGTGPLTINGSSSVVNVNSAVSVGTLSGTGASQLNVGSGTVLTVTQSGSATYAGTLSLAGSAGLVINQGSGNTLTISGAPSLGSLSSVAVNSGTLAFTNSTAATVGSNGASVSVASGATLQLSGSAAALSSTVNITTAGTGSSGDGALVLSGATTQTVGIVSGTALSGSVTTYAGNTTVGDGTNAANLTATQILQNTLTINAGSTVTIAPSGSGMMDTDSAATAVVASSAAASGAAAVSTSSDVSSDPFTAIQAAIASGSISSIKGAQLENRIAAIERLAATDPGLDVSLLEDRVLASLPATSVLPSTDSSPLGETGSGLLSVDSGTSSSASGGATFAFAPAAGFGGSPAAVPEPSTLLLAALGGIGLLIAVRRQTVACKSS
jgi:autotransporter-associated beta strand protein